MVLANSKLENYQIGYLRNKMGGQIKRSVRIKVSTFYLLSGSLEALRTAKPPEKSSNKPFLVDHWRLLNKVSFYYFLHLSYQYFEAIIFTVFLNRKTKLEQSVTRFILFFFILSHRAAMSVCSRLLSEDTNDSKHTQIISHDLRIRVTRACSTYTQG